VRYISILLIGLLAGCDIGFKNETGVLNSGTLVDFRYHVHNRLRQPVSEVNGKLMAVATWKISYVDVNGKFGTCDYFTESGSGSLKRNTFVKCSDQPLLFN
jgi:hypothetical protein